MNQSESITKIAAALIAVQGELKSITKDSTNPHFKNKYASLDTITETVRPILAKHGLAVLQGTVSPQSDELMHLKNVTVETRLVHSSGEWISNSVVLPVGTVPVKLDGKQVGAEPTAQTAGGAVTYGRRYGLAALLALTTDEDDDGNAASERAPASQNRYPDTRKAPEDKVMPIGKPDVKGKKLGDIPTEKLVGALEWMQTTDPKKFKDLIGTIETVLDNRREAVGAGMPEAIKDGPDDLPFA